MQQILGQICRKRRSESVVCPKMKYCHIFTPPHVISNLNEFYLWICVIQNMFFEEYTCACNESKCLNLPTDFHCMVKNTLSFMFHRNNTICQFCSFNMYFEDTGSFCMKHTWLFLYIIPLWIEILLEVPLQLSWFISYFTGQWKSDVI